MSIRHRVLELSVVVTLGASTAAGAQDLNFTYLEGGYIAGFVNDVEDSGAFTDDGIGGEVVTYEFGKITTWNLGVRFTF